MVGNKSSNACIQDLPEGTVTFLFTDIEGSTKLLRKLGDQYAEVLADQRRILRAIIAKWHGREVDTQGDSFFVSFPRATEALAAAVDIQHSLAEHEWPHNVQMRLRMGLHTGEPWTAQEGYVGLDVHRAARIAHVGHGGQVLLSETTAALVRDALPEGTKLLDLGRHRLKDIEKPERIRQLVIQGLPSKFPPLKSMEAIDAEKQVIPHNLPIQSTPFVGREKELADLARLLGDPEIRLITIVAPGGMGKTRLALALAERQIEVSQEFSENGGGRFSDGVFFASLDGLEETEQLVPEIAKSLRFTITKPQQGIGQGDIPDRTPKLQLLDYFSNKCLLLVMDNFEHLLDGAGLLSEIQRRAPEVKLLVTSREVLELHGEQLYRLRGMSVPIAGSHIPSAEEFVDEYSSTRLFLQSARRSVPSFELQPRETYALAQICRLVGGMPLALELSAGWVDMLSVSEIAAEIEHGLDLLETSKIDIPERQKSVQAIFEGTWRRLSPVEQSLFSKLCVFRGGFTRKAATEVTRASLRQLADLMSKSLLLFDRHTSRYDIHRLLRQYGRDQLAVEPLQEHDVREKHSAYFLETIASSEDALYSEQYQRVADDIDSDLDNIRAVLRWAAAHQRLEHLGDAIPPLFQFYAWRHYDDILFKDAQVIVEGLDEQEEPEAKLVTARALARQGWLLSDPEDQKYVERSRVFLRDLELVPLDTRRDRAFLLGRAGNFILRSADYLAAREMLDESLDLFREVGDRWGEAETTRSIARFANAIGDRRLHADCIEECAAIREELGNPIGVAWSLSDRALTSVFNGNVKKAIEFGLRSRKIFIELGDLGSLAISASNMGFFYLFGGHFNEAVEAYGEAIASQEKLGVDAAKLFSVVNQAYSYLHNGDYNRAYLLAHQLFEDHAQLNDGFVKGIGYNILANFALASMDYEEALRRGKQAVESFREIATSPGWLSLSLNTCSIAGVLGVDEIAGKRYLLEVLQLAERVKAPIVFFGILPAAALVAADEGDIDRAVELYETACQHPFVANSQWYKDVVGKRIDEKARGLPHEIVKAARQRGQEQDPIQMAEELLAELEAEV